MVSGKTIMIVEDEADLRDILCYNLEKEGYVCRCVADGGKAIDEIRRHPPDLVILDRMIPGRSGDEVAMAAQRDQRTAGIPIIMLTAKAEESDQLVGFALGALDYVTKPFSMKVLMARVAAAFRRPDAPTAETSKQLSGGPIRLDEARHEVTVDDTPVNLTTTEFRILRTLMSAAGRVLDRTQLIDAVLGPTVAVTDRTIDVHIAGLRKKLAGVSRANAPAPSDPAQSDPASIGDAAAWVQTVRGVGYTFREPQ